MPAADGSALGRPMRWPQKMASAEGARGEAASASEPAEVGGADRAQARVAVVRASLRLARGPTIAKLKSTIRWPIQRSCGCSEPARHRVRAGVGHESIREAR